MNLLRLRTKPRNKIIRIVTLALFVSVCLASASYGSAELIIGINNQPDHLAKGVVSSYRTSDVVMAQSEITIFISSEYVGKVNLMLAVSGDNSLVPQVNGQAAQQIQNSSDPLLAENMNPPYYLWNIENLARSNSDWTFAFKYENNDYYAKTFSLTDINDKSYVRVFIDNDNDYYYSLGDIVSGLPGPANTAFGDNSRAAFNMLINDESELIVAKAYDGDNGNEVITGTTPYLLVDGVQINPIADYRHDVLIDFANNMQVWTLLKEFTPWQNVNILGLYTDPGQGNSRSTIFEGPRSEGYTYTTYLTEGVPIGLWMLNDTNGDTIYNGSDSWLFSERFLTRSSFSNEHQWFMVYDVRAYKDMGSTYQFICPAEDFTNTGNFDYLIYIDDDHTSANWDHNDMIFGISCSPAPDSCGNFEPGVPPNYFMVDTSYFIGAPTLPVPPPDSGGVYVYLDTTNYHWTIACHIYSLGNSMEQFHGNIVAIMDEPPQLGVNIFFDNFELWEDTTDNRCLFQNDRWGWSLWDSALGLYEIWWDVATREYQQGEGDLNDFLTIELIGTALDFNVWSSGHNLGFDEYQIYLGAAMTPLGSLPGYYDYGSYEVIDRYQAEVGSDPANDPNTSVFSRHCGPGESYNAYGLIQATDSYYCDSEYGLNYGGPFVYQADGLQFSTWGVGDHCENNNPPVCNLVDDAQFFVCDDTTFNFYITADDPDENLIGCTKLSGPGSYDNEYWTFTTTGPGVYSATFECEDFCGATCSGTVNIAVNYNTPPTAVCPGNQTKFVCDPEAEICIPGFAYSDPEDNVVSVQVIGCELHQDTVCFVPEGSSKTITYIVTDACGAADTCVTVITLNYNLPPTVDCPNDTTIFVCDYSEICLPGFTYIDPNDNIETVQIIGCEIEEDTVCFTPTGPSKTITLIVIDECGLADTCVTNVNIVLNSPPVASCPTNTTMFVCNLNDICIDGFIASDPDNNITSKVVSNGTLTGTEVCFTPVEGLNTITFTVTDACGAMDECTTNITVNLNDPPFASCPDDTTLFVCNLNSICLDGFVASDPDNNITSRAVDNGTLNGTQVCFTPVEGLNTITYTVTDACGATDQCVTQVTVTLNRPPVAACPDNTSMMVCDLDPICIDGFVSSDPDNNIVSRSVNNGTLNGTEVCFTPIAGLNTITYTVTDACGAIDQCVTEIMITLNSPPVASCPDDTSIFMCELTEICFPGFTCSDIDDNIVSRGVNIGVLNGEVVCFTPVEGINTIIFTVTDACGATSQCVTNINVSLNNPPVAQGPFDSKKDGKPAAADTTIFICSLTQICLDGFYCTDPDDNLQSCEAFGGTLNGTEVCFTPVEGFNTITLIATDDCGAKDTSITIVDVVLNNPPSATCPGNANMFVCNLNDICIDGFIATDPDDNITSKVVSIGTLTGTQVCFTPVEGLNSITFTVTDACGATDQCVATVNVTLNRPPVADCPADVNMLVGNLNPICIDGFIASDPDNNIVSRVVDNGTLTGTQVCFTPVEGLNTITFTVTDACGATDQCVTQVTVTLNNPPTCNVPNDTTIFQCVIAQVNLPVSCSDIDGNLAPGYPAIVSGPGTIVGGNWRYTPSGNQTVTVTIRCQDIYGEFCEDTFNVTFDINEPPICGTPNDTTIFQCTPTQVCLPVSCSDADGNLASGYPIKVSGPGTISGGNWCYTPSGDGAVAVTVRCQDACGAYCEETFNVTFNINTAPVCSVPNDTTIFQCVPTQVCLPVSCFDEDGNLASGYPIKVSGPGTISGGNWCYTPSGDGAVAVTVRCQDNCGAYCEETFNVTFNINTAPVCAAPNDTTIFQCTPTQVCLPVSCFDEDGNLASGYPLKVSGPGTISGGNWCYLPSGDEAVTVTIRCQDDCGAYCEETFNVTFMINAAPICSTPNDTTIFQCAPAQVCLPVSCSDEDGNLASGYPIKVSGPGTISGGSWCYTPSGDEVAVVTIRCQDICGAYCEETFNVTFNMNAAPVCDVPNDTTIFQCAPAQVCLPVSCSDEDGNLASGYPMKISGPGTISGDNWCYTPVGGEAVAVTIRCQDDCGAFCEETFNVTFVMNSAPICGAPNDTTIFQCAPAQVCLPVTCFDIDGNLASGYPLKISGPGTLSGGNWCYTPSGDGAVAVTIRCQDICGAYCEETFNVTFSLNAAPVCFAPNDTTIFQCTPTQVCLPISCSDEDGNLASGYPMKVSGPGTISGGNWCYTPTGDGVASVTIRCQDNCGAYCEETFNVTFDINTAPVCNVPNDTTIFQCAPIQACLPVSCFDEDGNLASGYPMKVSGPGIISGGYWCYMPSGAGVVAVTVRCQDVCGAYCEETFNVTFTMNEPPETMCPEDSTFQVGDLSILCMPGFYYSDSDDNIETVTVNHGTIHGDTVCFTPVEGLNTICLTVTDECGAKDSCCSQFNIVVNTCPEIVRPADTTVMCVYENFCDTMEVFDADGDYIEMTANYGTFTPIVDEPGHWLGLYCFRIFDYDCGEHNNYQITVQADDGLCVYDVTVFYDITVLGYVDMFLDENVVVIPGFVGRIGLYLNTYDCLCVGGLNASLFWDPSVLTLVNIEPTENLDFGNEYHNINIDAFGPGSVKVTYIADLNNQIPHGPLCEIDPNEPIFYLDFQLAPGPYPIDFIIPICFANENIINDNSVTDESGYHVWWGDGCADSPDSSQFGTLLLNMECGSIRIIDECDLLIGDINFNRYPFEVGDAVLLANHLADPEQFPFLDMQLFASDVNGDSIQASIADLIYIINVINGFDPSGKITPIADPVEIIITDDSEGRTSLRLESDYDIGGLILELPKTGDSESILQINSELGMNYEIRENDDHLRLLIYSLEGNKISAGITEILDIQLPEGLEMSLSEISVSDTWGNLATALVTHELPLPEHFGIANCYPNPFNAQTTIEFTLPVADQISLSLYDINGRLVTELVSGSIDAGYHQIIWHGANRSGEQVSSGVYFARLKSLTDNSATSIEKLVLLK